MGTVAVVVTVIQVSVTVTVMVGTVMVGNRKRDRKYEMIYFQKERNTMSMLINYAREILRKVVAF